MSIVADYETHGLRAVIIKHDHMGYLCGYIGLPKGHPLHGRDYDDAHEHADVHGGWTYGGDSAPKLEADGRWYLGFDCAHAGDYCPGLGNPFDGDVYRDEDYVRGEIDRAAFMLAVSPAPSTAGGA